MAMRVRFLLGYLKAIGYEVEMVYVGEPCPSRIALRRRSLRSIPIGRAARYVSRLRAMACLLLIAIVALGFQVARACQRAHMWRGLGCDSLVRHQWSIEVSPQDKSLSFYGFPSSVLRSSSRASWCFKVVGRRRMPRSSAVEDAKLSKANGL